MRNNKKNGASKASPKLKIVPLGGLGEVGMNCMLIEFGDEAVIIDCGVTFPEVDVLGVDLVLPDWTYLLENADRIQGIILTHGHEDHIGALPFLLRDLDVPVFGTRMTLGLVAHKLTEHGLLDQCDLIEVGYRDETPIGSWSFEFIHVNHSIPDAAAIALHTPLGTLVHTGDWRVDHTPISEEPIDLSSFAELGENGVLCLLGDSTNVGVPGVSRSESEVLRGLEKVIMDAPERVLVTMFSSNVHRMQGLLSIAHRCGRRVLINGRSMENTSRIARELGFLKVPSDDIFMRFGELNHAPPSRVLIITTGSQGEPRSSLTRIAHGDHRQIKIQESDTVIFSARVVPGNENKVFGVQNALWARGAEVITPRDAPVHTSGHAYHDDLKLMINLVRPRYLVPVHGEPRMLIQHARLGRALGVEETCVLENGDVLTIDEDGPRRSGRVPCGRVLVDGKGVGDVNDLVIRDRMKLARAGIVVAVMVINTQTGEVVSGPDLLQQGVVVEGDPAEVLEEACDLALDKLDELSKESMRNVAEVTETLRMTLRRFFRKRFDRKPVVVPIVTEL